MANDLTPGDPLLQTLDTFIVSTQAVAALPAQPRAKKSKATSVESVTSSSPVLEVILHDTILFPEGGGQPSDIGAISLLGKDGNASATFEVAEVKRRGGTAVHFVKVNDSDASAFSPGKHVRLTLGEAGAARRLDHVSSLHIWCYFTSDLHVLDESSYHSTPFICCIGERISVTDPFMVVNDGSYALLC